MIKYLRKYLKNNKVGRARCEGILGTSTEVGKFSQFWKESGEDLMVASAAMIHEYIATQEFTKEEAEAYKAGVADLGAFFKDCWDERQMKAEEELKRRQV